ncbi:MAG: hypothetical protein KDA29_04220 [Phycisphaerales bacterium]|nr:hypothetical protein [Phycisphaerales bacterium]
MRTKTSWDDEYTLLCENCGYVIEGLDPAGNCPECGKTIAESLPERRVGTPWQQSPGVWSLVRTWWMTLRHPLRTLDVMRIDGHQRKSLWDWTITLIILLPVPVCLFGIFELGQGMQLNQGIRTHGVPGAWTFTPGYFFVMIPVLTATEALGLRVIARQRGFRVPRDISKTITAHGAVGWLAMSTGLTLSFIYIAIPIALHGNPDGAFDSRLRGLIMWAWPMIGFSFLFGFLFFETFAYLGLRRCKFANRVRPESPSQGATTRVEDAQ